MDLYPCYNRAVDYNVASPGKDERVDIGLLACSSVYLRFSYLKHNNTTSEAFTWTDGPESHSSTILPVGLASSVS
jgi:hypothetical protein